ncbi:MAG: 4-hydroxy-tetrahydrodipicolinate reductase [Denitrovibrio sp.]|nr:MAG: 4-hydroxy-tetrahydrodipicolinate reductase [Denitrovibrio sp.]
MSLVKIAMVGAAGRMGRRIISLIQEDDRCELSGALEYSACPFLGHDAGDVAGCGKIGVEITDDIDKAFAGADVFIDFTGAEPTMANLEKYENAGVAAIIASTGMTSKQTKELEKLSVNMPVLFSANMSVGVNLTFKVLENVAEVIGEDWDIEIVESHHRNKKDAPSGTAMKMGEIIANVLGRDIEKDGAFSRHGIIGERTDREIGMQTLRAGDIVGEHTVMFCTNGERIEITHRAHTRDMFAKGAIRAAVWMKDKPNGYYDMFQVLGL